MLQRKVKVKTLEATKYSKMLSVKIIFKLKIRRKNAVIWNHKDSDSIHVDPNHTILNQTIPDDSTNIGSINDSANICVIENILSSPVHSVHTAYLVLAPPIFNFGTASDPQSPSHDQSSEIVTTK